MTPQLHRSASWPYFFRSTCTRGSPVSLRPAAAEPAPSCLACRAEVHHYSLGCEPSRELTQQSLHRRARILTDCCHVVEIEPVSASVRTSGAT